MRLAKADSSVSSTRFDGLSGPGMVILLLWGMLALRSWRLNSGASYIGVASLARLRMTAVAAAKASSPDIEMINV